MSNVTAAVAFYTKQMMYLVFDLGEKLMNIDFLRGCVLLCLYVCIFLE